MLQINEVLAASKLKVKPGAGAIKLARQYINTDTEYYDALEIMEDIINGCFDEVEDKRIKRCDYCGYFYQDNTKHNYSRTCSTECKRKKDIELKKARYKKQRRSFKELHSAHHLEYPFWESEDHMEEYERKQGCYSYGDNFESYIAQEKNKEAIGGKKKTPQIIDYDGNKPSHDIDVKLPFRDEPPINYPTVKCSKEEMETELLARYGAEKLRQERIRAKMYANLSATISAISEEAF